MRSSSPVRHGLILVVPICLVLASCGGAKKVGAGVDTAHGGGNKTLAFGDEASTTTTIPKLQFTLPPTTAPATTVPRSTAAPQVTTPVATTRAPVTTQPVQSFQIVTINPDRSSDTQFSPSALSVYVGTPVHFQNHDVKPRSVVADSGAFRSPVIPPGGEWIYGAPTPGTFNYQDGTRPYAVGSLQVVRK